MTLGDRLKQYRAQEIITQKKMADRCGVSVQTINSIESGTQEASLLTTAKIEKVIGKEEQNESINQ